MAMSIFASENLNLKRWGRRAFFGCGLLLLLIAASPWIISVFPTEEGSDSPAPSALESERRTESAMPLGGISNLSPSPKLDQTVLVDSRPRQGHTYDLYPDGCAHSEVRAEAHVGSSFAHIKFEAVLVDDSLKETRVGLSISQGNLRVAEADLHRAQPVTLEADLKNGKFTIVFTSLNGTDASCLDSKFTVLLQNFILVEG